MYECNDMMSMFILKYFSREKNVDIVESGWGYCMLEILQNKNEKTEVSIVHTVK